MRANRKQRLATALFVLGGVAVTVALTLLALEENVNLFYEPAKVVGGEAPRGYRFAPATWWSPAAWSTTTPASAFASR